MAKIMLFFLLIFTGSSLVQAETGGRRQSIIARIDSIKNDSLSKQAPSKDFKSDSASVAKVGLIIVWVVGGFFLIAYFALKDGF